MGFCRRGIASLGRIFISLIFVVAAVEKIFNWSKTLETFTSLLDDWSLYVCSWQWAEESLGLMRENAVVCLVAGVAFELIGGLFILLGIRPKLGAALLTLFLIPTTILYHHFWFYAGQRRDLELIMFLKNLSIIGGLLTLYVFGKPESKSYHPEEESDSSFH